LDRGSCSEKKKNSGNRLLQEKKHRYENVKPSIVTRNGGQYEKGGTPARKKNTKPAKERENTLLHLSKDNLLPEGLQVRRGSLGSGKVQVGRWAAAVAPSMSL